MSRLKRMALPVTPESVRALWQVLGRLFGARRVRLLVHPALGLLLALADTLGLLAIIRLLLLLVDEAETTEVAAGPIEVRLSFAELAIVATAALLASLGLRFLEGRYSSRNQAYAIARARDLAVDAWFAADWEQLHGARLGRLQQLLGVNAQQAAVPVSVLSIGSVAFLSLLLYVSIVLVAAPVVALLFAAVALFMAALMRPMRRRAKDLARSHAELTGDLQLTATSYAQLNRELHVFGVQHAAATRLKAMSARTASAFARLKLLQRVLPNVYQQLLLLSVVAIVVLGRWLDVPAVQFGTAAILAVRSLTYVQQLNSAFQIFVETRPFLDDLLDSVAETRRLRRPRGDRDLEAVRSITLRDVHFRYPTGVEALQGIDLDLASGDWLGIIGPSGGGKTTLANVIAGLLSPTEGSYAVNGRAAEEHSATSWVAQFALLSQEPVLLPATVAENIEFHRDIPDDAVRAAADAAGILREVEALEAGFDTPVGEGSSSLSGGQRQRLALARCLAGAPTCLILDEPTSALDRANEALVQESLASIPEDIIVVVVSHRPALLERCNRFLVLEDGAPVAAGTADDVALAGRVGRAGS